ncbi:MAG: bifunctional methylenetetrahydrofolate dehydrogenase/methenyltetrahydrofolate cyclohydrolase FolD [Clostridia bacterium]|nr:bifunctional methylenetetrahydrofolate dehydrogenase/methenyltetrahydrofolate cyclohydrolase FolD [Clostridia bacterium]MBQ5808744.1 bifunctional methylenetetrahydrofolate dehydrogenase/methenyltetrahydrofolate cyclohydrolase FolD [Clostridia bacterium]
MSLIDGKAIAAENREKTAKRVAEFIEKYGRAPKLTVIRVGNDQASIVYVRNKKTACEAAGMLSEVIEMPEETEESFLLAKIAELNADDTVDGILVQLPLPRHISERAVIKAISPEKDVDCFHPQNAGLIFNLEEATFLPCTPAGVMELLHHENVKISGKNAVVVGRSNIVGKPVALLLLSENATVTVCHSRTENLAEVTRSADILVSAVGKAGFITADMVKEGAVVIDVGINRDANGKLCGDVDFNEVAKKASLITPVPGGVGPMTITMLLSNTVNAAFAAEERKKQK